MAIKGQPEMEWTCVEDRVMLYHGEPLQNEDEQVQPMPEQVDKGVDEMAEDPCVDPADLNRTRLFLHRPGELRQPEGVQIPVRAEEDDADPQLPDILPLGQPALPPDMVEPGVVKDPDDMGLNNDDDIPFQENPLQLSPPTSATPPPCRGRGRPQKEEAAPYSGRSL